MKILETDLYIQTNFLNVEMILLIDAKLVDILQRVNYEFGGPFSYKGKSIVSNQIKCVLVKHHLHCSPAKIIYLALSFLQVNLWGCKNHLVIRKSKAHSQYCEGTPNNVFCSS
jgi:hypothetical protein